MRPSPCLAITSENFSGGIRTNRGEKEIIFPRELAAMESLDRPQVQVVHVLSRPSPVGGAVAAAWTGLCSSSCWVGRWCKALVSFPIRIKMAA